jgi:hypothetical protein
MRISIIKEHNTHTMHNTHRHNAHTDRRRTHTHTPAAVSSSTATRLERRENARQHSTGGRTNTHRHSRSLTRRAMTLVTHAYVSWHQNACIIYKEKALPHHHASALGLQLDLHVATVAPVAYRKHSHAASRTRQTWIKQHTMTAGLISVASSLRTRQQEAHQHREADRTRQDRRRGRRAACRESMMPALARE